MKNIFAYTALGPSPAYCSINEDENGVVIVTVRAKDGREASVEIPKAEAALLQQGEPEGWREAKRIADLWFEPWGAAKAIEWEFSGDVPFTPENALRKIQRLLSASPLPPAPGAETGERKPGEVLQEALLDLVRLCTRNNIGDLDLRLGGVVADGKNVGDWHLTLKSLATTPPAEGERK